MLVLLLTFDRFCIKIDIMQDNNTEIRNISFEELVDIFTEINDRDFMKNFMECLFTPAERDRVMIYTSTPPYPVKFCFSYNNLDRTYVLGYNTNIRLIFLAL